MSFIQAPPGEQAAPPGSYSPPPQGFDQWFMKVLGILLTVWAAYMTIRVEHFAEHLDGMTGKIDSVAASLGGSLPQRRQVLKIPTDAPPQK